MRFEFILIGSLLLAGCSSEKKQVSQPRKDVPKYDSMAKTAASNARLEYEMKARAGKTGGLSLNAYKGDLSEDQKAKILKRRMEMRKDMKASTFKQKVQMEKIRAWRNLPPETRAKTPMPEYDPNAFAKSMGLGK